MRTPNAGKIRFALMTLTFSIAAVVACSSDEAEPGMDGGEAGSGTVESSDYVGLLAGPDGQAAELDLSVFPRERATGVTPQALGIPGSVSGVVRFPSSIGPVTLVGEVDARGEVITFEGKAVASGQVVDCSASIRDERLEGDCRVAGQRWPLQALTARLGTIQRFCGNLEANGVESGTLHVLAANRFAAGVLWAPPLTTSVSGTRTSNRFELDVSGFEGAGAGDAIAGTIAASSVSGTYRLSGLAAEQREGTFSASEDACPSGRGDSGGGAGGAGGSPSDAGAGAAGVGGMPDAGGAPTGGAGAPDAGAAGQASARVINSGYLNPGNLVADTDNAYFVAERSGKAAQLYKVAVSDGTETPITTLEGTETVYLFGSDVIFTNHSYVNYPNPSPGAIRKVPRAGGAVTPLWTSNATNGVGGLMFDTTNGRIYFFSDRSLTPGSPSTSIAYIPTQGGTATPVKTVPYVAGPVMHDALNVYLYGLDWNQQGASTAAYFIRQPLDAGNPIASPVGAAGGFVTAVEGDKLYVCHQAFSTFVERITRSTGLVEVLAKADDGCRDLQLDANHLYWATNLGGLQRATKAPKNVDSALDLMPETLLPKEARVVSLALVGTEIYYLAANVGAPAVYDGTLEVMSKR